MTLKCDQETLLSRAGDEDVWHVWSTDQRMIGKIRRLAKSLSIQVKSGTKVGVWVEVLVPADRVNVLGLLARRKKLEGHRREAALAALRAARAGRNARKVTTTARKGIDAAGHGQEPGREAEALLPVGRAES